MNRTEKAELIETLQSTLSEATSVVVTHQIGLTVAESSELRARMREAGAGFKVTKNRLTKIALQGTKYEEITELFSGPTAMGTSPDPVIPPECCKMRLKTIAYELESIFYHLYQLPDGSGPLEN